VPVSKNRSTSRMAKKIKDLLALGASFVPRVASGKLGALRRESARASRLPNLSGGSSPVFFVVGHQKSGTTWLMELLNSHPEILCKGEGRPFGRTFRQENLKQKRVGHPPTSLYNAIASSEDLRYWIERSVWSKHDDADEHLADLTRLAIDHFLTQQLSKTGKRLVGDKTVLLGPEIVEEISAIYPEARVIHIIRDGRDVVLSTMHHRWNQAEDRGGTVELAPDQLAKREAYRKNPRALLESGEGIFPDGWLRGNAAKWNARVSRAVKDGPALLGANYREVRYEALLVRPKEEFKQLLEFLGVDASEQTVERCVSAASFERLAGGRSRGQEAPSFFRKGIAGDWKNAFTESDKQDFKAVAGDLLIELGYEKDNDW
jgi:hypothetical protein